MGGMASPLLSGAVKDTSTGTSTGPVASGHCADLAVVMCAALVTACDIVQALAGWKTQVTTTESLQAVPAQLLQQLLLHMKAHPRLLICPPRTYLALVV